MYPLVIEAGEGRVAIIRFDHAKTGALQRHGNGGSDAGGVFHNKDGFGHKGDSFTGVICIRVTWVEAS
ncbi:hypothetical protein JUNP479_0478 [Aeromonas jandaei]|nr:hypothetical protein JUNP479_0478 [Aeromonas jandaei]